MRIVKLFSITFLLICITFGTIGGCGGGDEDNNGASSSNGGGLAGEQNCTDGIDNDSDTDTDCDDIDCILDPACMVEDTPEDTTPDTPTLIEPINNQTIQQNNPDIGCQFDAFFGFGYEIFFDWTDSEASSGISGYNLFVIGPNAIFPLIDIFVTESEFTFTSCNSFIIDSNLMGWQWNVQAVGNGAKLISQGKLSEVSESQTFQFEPCKCQDGAGCGGESPPDIPSGPPPPEGTIIVPSSLVTTEAGSRNGFPLGCITSSTLRYQQVYLASEFGSNSCNINEIRFRTDATGSVGPNMRTQNEVTIQFSTTSVSPATLSTTYANNIGADVTTVFNGNLTFDISPPCGLPGPCPFDTIINLQTPFPYNPSMGNLLLDIGIADCTVDINNQSFWDATGGGTATVVNRLFNFDVNAPTGNIDGGRGVVTQFVCE